MAGRARTTIPDEVKAAALADLMLLSPAAVGVWYATEHIITASGQEDERSIAVALRAL